MAKADKSDGLKLIESGDRHLQAGRLGKARRAFDEARSAYERMLCAEGSGAGGAGRLEPRSLNRLGAVERVASLMRHMSATRDPLRSSASSSMSPARHPRRCGTRSIILGQLANVERMRGQLDGAYARYGQKLDIDRKILR